MWQQDEDDPKIGDFSKRAQKEREHDHIQTQKQLKEIQQLQPASIESVRRYVSDVLTKTGGPDPKRDERLRAAPTQLSYEEEERIAIIESDKDSVYW